MFKKVIIMAVIIFSVHSAYAKDVSNVTPIEESDQQINEFSLSGYADKGKKNWDLAGKTADIFDTTVKLTDVVGNMYGETENIKITSKKGDFDKVEGKVHLEDDVVITTTSGAKLTTESLDWDRKHQLLSSKDRVNIEKENMVTTAIGIKGEPNLNKVNLEKDVQVEINPTKPGTKNAPEIKDKVIITCDGPLEIDYEKNIAVFKNNVKADNKDSLIYCDIMDVYFAKADKDAPKVADASASLMNSKIDKLLCHGHVKITKGSNTSYSEEATYSAIDKKIILTGRPKLELYSTEDFKGMFTVN